MCMLAIFGYVIFSTVCQNARILKLKVFFKEIRENLGISKYVRIKIGFIKKTLNIPLRRLKRSIFLGQGPVQGPQEEVQGPCARATIRGARASGFSKTLNHVFSTILLSVQFH